MKATDSLLADHRMVRKLLTDFRFDNPRFAQIAETTHRVLAGHAWFEDALFFPALAKSPVLMRRFVENVSTEHEDIDAVLALLRQPDVDVALRDGYLRQFRSLIETHFAKEEDALFPLAGHILDEEGLNRLGDEMRARQKESVAAYRWPR